MTKVKEAYDILNKSEKEFKETILKMKDDTHDLKVTVLKKQDAINSYLDKIQYPQERPFQGEIGNGTCEEEIGELLELCLCS